jgi:hypothetical protein
MILTVLLLALTLAAGCAPTYPEAYQPAYKSFSEPISFEPDPAGGSGNASNTW